LHDEEEASYGISGAVSKIGGKRGGKYGPLWEEIARIGQKSNAQNEKRQTQEWPERKKSSEPETGRCHRPLGSAQEGSQGTVPAQEKD
jgi:hypothetical protein